MTADEIRNLMTSDFSDVERAKVVIFKEIALQLAELNEKLERIIEPPHTLAAIPAVGILARTIPAALRVRP